MMNNMVLAFLTYFITIFIAYINAYEYGSFHNSEPPFHYFRNRFSCIAEQKTILWDSLTVEVHPGASAGCGVNLLRDEASELWSSIDDCLNNEDTTSADCNYDGEHQTSVYRVNQTKLLDSNITFPCARNEERPEIIAIHIIYTCSGHQLHEDEEETTQSSLLPPPPPPRAPSMMGEPTTGGLPPPPPRAHPTMLVEPTEFSLPVTTHNIVTHGNIETTKPATIPPKKDHYDRIKPKNGHIGEDNLFTNTDKEEVGSHPITANELAVIVGPSVAAIAVLLIVLVIVLVVMRRRSIKFPTDLQGESLFNSRRFSTASQISDISLNNHQMRSVP